MNLNVDFLMEKRGKKAKLSFPDQIMEVIKEYQSAYKDRHNKFVSQENVLWKLAWHGKDAVVYETDKMINEFKNYVK